MYHLKSRPGLIHTPFWVYTHSHSGVQCSLPFTIWLWLPFLAPIPRFPYGDSSFLLSTLPP